MFSKTTSYLKKTVIVMNVAVGVVPLIGILLQLSALSQYWLNIIVILLEIVLLFLGKRLERKVDMDILKQSKQSVLDQIAPACHNEVEKARSELRKGLQILFVPAELLLVGLFLAHVLTIRWALAGGLILVIAFIYADYIPHSQRYAKDYDALFITQGENPNALRGLARIYFDEYKETSFKKNSSLYKNEEVDVISAQGEGKSVETQEYVKCVLGIRADKTDNTLAILGYSMLAVNVLTLMPDFYELIFGGVLNTAINIVDFINIMAPVIFMVVSICQIYEYNEECFLINMIWNSIQSQDIEKMVDTYNEVLRNENGNLCRVRGRHVYTQKMLEQNKNISSVPMKYRMKFPDKYYANVVRYDFTYLLTTAIIFLMMLEYNRVSKVILVFFALLAVLAYIIGKYLLLPEIGKKRIGRECEKLKSNCEK